ncbi:MAG: SRPBCC family protein, partial [Actinomycetota bacterium]
FEVQYDVGPTSVPLRYEITAYDRPRRVVLSTVGLTHRGEDDVTFAAVDGGTRVTWDAHFELRGPGRLLDPLLAVGFRKVCSEALRGLEAALRSLGA